MPMPSEASLTTPYADQGLIESYIHYILSLGASASLSWILQSRTQTAGMAGLCALSPCAMNANLPRRAASLTGPRNGWAENGKERVPRLLAEDDPSEIFEAEESGVWNGHGNFIWATRQWNLANEFRVQDE